MSKFCLFPKPPQYLLDSNGFVVLGGAKDGQIGQMGGKGLGHDKLIFAITSSFGGHFFAVSILWDAVRPPLLSWTKRHPLSFQDTDFVLGGGCN